jgi:Kdo2-lipid A phosphotransferase
MKTKYFYYAYLPLLLSFILVPHSYFWDPINHAVFKLFNSSLHLGKPIQIFWALLNNHYNDWFIDVVFLCFFIKYIKTSDEKSKIQKTVELFTVAAVMFFTIFVVNKIIFRNYFPIQIDSPSLKFSGYLNINILLPLIKSKVFAYGCFPGDHATTAMLFYFLTKPLFSHKTSKFLGIYIIFLILPRLVIGAHNFTDVLLGSLPIAFTTATLWHQKNFISKFAQIASLKIKALLFKKKTSPL